MVRKRHRYVTLDVKKDGEWSKGAAPRSSQMFQALMSSVRTLYGIQGVALAKTGLNFEFLGAETSLARITMRRSAYKIVTSALQLVTVADGGKVTIRTLHTAATIRHANLFCQKYLRRAVEQQIATASPAEQQKLLLAMKGNNSRSSNPKKRKIETPVERQAESTPKKLKLQQKLEKLKQLKIALRQ